MEATQPLKWPDGEATSRSEPVHIGTGACEAVRRAIDIAVSVSVLLAASPVLLLIALTVRLDSPGPSLFRQLRTGRGGRRFRMYKFRTMMVDAEARKGELADLSHLPAPNFKVRSDPRVTRVGAVLRAWSLDELPNLINVVRGEMSLVGPRPTSWAPECYDQRCRTLLAVRPGVTGLWQVNGRADVSAEERVRLEQEYMRRRSLAFDLMILLRTIPAVLSRRGAY